MGPLAEIVREAPQPAGYDVRVCYNCNLSDSPRYVAYAWKPRPLTAQDIEINDPPPPDGPVDFGVTESNFLAWLYEGKQIYASDGPQRQLRLLARIEDPVYILVAVKSGSGITDLAQLASLKRPLRILSENDPWIQPILQHYHLTRAEVEAAGGKFSNAMALHKDGDFDLRYLDVPHDVLRRIVATLGGEITWVPVGYLRGVDRRIETVGRSGQAIFGRADMPDDFAYAVAKAMEPCGRTGRSSCTPVPSATIGRWGI